MATAMSTPATKRGLLEKPDLIDPLD